MKKQLVLRTTNNGKFVEFKPIPWAAVALWSLVAVVTGVLITLVVTA